MGRGQEALRSTNEAVSIARDTGSDEKLPKALRAAAEIRSELGYLDSALAFRRECLTLERLHNTDRGKWLYELSEIIQLLSRMGLHQEAERNCADLAKGIEAEPLARGDAPFIKGLYQILADACEQARTATGNTAYAADIEKWRILTNKPADPPP
jgi:hypothetical protein